MHIHIQIRRADSPLNVPILAPDESTQRAIVSAFKERPQDLMKRPQTQEGNPEGMRLAKKLLKGSAAGA